MFVTVRMVSFEPSPSARERRMLAEVSYGGIGYGRAEEDTGKEICIS
jgi:hypothetical protein